MTIDDMFFKVLAKVLKEERTYLAKTQQEVYQDIGMYIGRVEMGIRSINVTTLLKVCNYYKINVSEIFQRVENEIVKHNSLQKDLYVTQIQ